ncbi:MAG: LysE family translocator [Granulosicoccus sp.]
MLENVNLSLILLAAFIATVSPGPATLAIAGTSMSLGRKSGLALAAGITTGSLSWSIAAALGLGTLMLANAWVFETVRYFGAAYLMYLGYKSARSAFSTKTLETLKVSGSLVRIYAKGVALHVTNPKAILFFGSLYAIGMPADATARDLLIVIGALGIQSMIIFHGYAVLFSVPATTRIYLRMRRWFEGAFAIGFTVACFKVLSARIE